MIPNDTSKILLFISYSSKDEDKVGLIAKELEGHFLFEPKIIATDREALKFLKDKVIEGINESKVIIPVLTSNSFETQWINQEIGYSLCAHKKIYPIVEADLLKKLKGFIHKEMDLPYKYEKNPSKKIENENFLNVFRILIEDLEKLADDLKDQEVKIQFV